MLGGWVFLASKPLVCAFWATHQNFFDFETVQVGRKTSGSKCFITATLACQSSWIAEIYKIQKSKIADLFFKKLIWIIFSQLEYHQTIIVFDKKGAIKWNLRNSGQFDSWTGEENLKIVNKNNLWTIHAVQIWQITQTYTQSTTTTEFYYYCYEEHTLPWRGGMLLTGQVKGLGPSGGAAACISWPLPVGVTVKHTRKTWRSSLTRAVRNKEQERTKKEEERGKEKWWRWKIAESKERAKQKSESLYTANPNVYTRKEQLNTMRQTIHNNLCRA